MAAQIAMMEFHVPSDQEVLAWLGQITLRHAHLDHVLRMTIKTVTETQMQEALDATAFEGSSAMRRRIQRLAKKRLGDGPALIKLEALLERARRVTERRNELIHSIWARNADGDARVRTDDHSWKPTPTVEELKVLESDITAVTYELNGARLNGFLAEAMKSGPPRHAD